MSSRNLILLFCALFIAGLTAFALRSRIQPPAETPTATVPVTRVLVAKKDIPLGGFVRTGQDIGYEVWPASAIHDYNIKEGAEPLESFEGAVARRALKAGEGITANALIKPGAGGFLSAVLEPGKRAVSVGVTPTSGNAGFIFPGDKVDLILTHRVKMMKTQAEGDADEVILSETFAENLRVVAVDQQMDNPENKAIMAKTVTVEATPKQAEKIQVAEELGKIAFSLRSLSDSAVTPGHEEGVMPTLSLPAPATESYTRDSDVSPSLERNSGTNPRIRVIRGDQDQRLEFNRSNR